VIEALVEHNMALVVHYRLGDDEVHSKVLVVPME
jgi:hypothetical protein